MFGFKERRMVRDAKRAYEAARLRRLIADNQRRLDELSEPTECRLCKEKSQAVQS